jgi:hypothetical protein
MIPHRFGENTKSLNLVTPTDARVNLVLSPNGHEIGFLLTLLLKR